MVLENRGKKFLMLACVFMLAGMLAAGVTEEGVKDAKPSGLLAGVAKVNIDPAVGIPHQNWGSATHIVANVLDPAGMFVRCMTRSRTAFMPTWARSNARFRVTNCGAPMPKSSA